jgi:diazepam-binding inhibitor (GABA receptor modulator, acyl-CoA-binding protein)
MSIDTTFVHAQERVRTLRKPPLNADLLELYALYKQASIGDVEGPRPGVVDFVGRAKFDAWAGKKGISRHAAMERYVALVQRLLVD